MKSKSGQAENSVSPGELARRQRSDCALELIDVRTAPEHAAAHVAGAQPVPLDQLDPAAFLKARKCPYAPLYVICQSGARAAKAVERFRNIGFAGCVLVEGGTQAWIDAGLPVERGQSRVLPLMRQVQIVVGSLSVLGAAMALGLDARFALIPLVLGGGLLFAGMTGTCGLALLLAKMPWNQPATCTSASLSK
jgi:rhodanese-related sulfurtransferase